MNSGERSEYIAKLRLTFSRDQNEFLAGKELQSVGFNVNEYDFPYKTFDEQIFKDMSDDELKSFAKKCGIKKSPGRAKADVFINGEGVSLKSLDSSPPALVNHTTRPGFEFACQCTGTNIFLLDEIIDDYWKKRLDGRIGEDTKISDDLCPFAPYKNYLRPLIEYFLFCGTGKKISPFPAEYLMEIADPMNISTYNKLEKEEAFESVWHKLIFSVRSKGMPKNYNPNTHASIARWTRFVNGKYKGALHIRVSR